MHTFLDGRLTVKVGDLTEEEVDAIVNAANWTLLGGGGVDGAIHHKGGPEIYKACKRLRETELPAGLPTGQAVITTAGRLPANYVIHTVGPIYGQNAGRDAELLADSYRNSLQLAMRENLSSIAFPSISTGAFGYPKHQAAPVVVSAIRSELELIPTVANVRLVFHSESDAKLFLKHSEL